MNRKKIIAGAIIAFAAGVAAFVYNKRRNSVSAAAKDTYDYMDDTINRVEDDTERMFS